MNYRHAMPKSRSPPQLSVYDILNKAQDGIAGHKKFAKLLWDVVNSDLSTAFQQLTNCISHLLLVAQARNVFYKIANSRNSALLAKFGPRNCAFVLEPIFRHDIAPIDAEYILLQIFGMKISSRSA